MCIDSRPNRFRRFFPARGALLTTAALFAVLSAAPASAGCLDDVSSLRQQIQSGALKVIDTSPDASKDTKAMAATRTDTPAKSRLDATLEAAPAQSGATGQAAAGQPSTGLTSTGQTSTQMSAEADSKEVVEVETTTGSVEVPVGDGLPRENWFGRPPAAETVEAYLDGAEASGQAGDMAACMEQVMNARAALTAADQ